LKKIDKIYKLIADNRQRFVDIASYYTKDKTIIDDVVQEQMLYFMQMNKETLLDIYEKDGIEGLVKYGAVAIHRAVTSSRSNYYYKYRKYYTRIDESHIENSYFTDRPSTYRRSISQIPDVVCESLYRKQAIEKVEKELENMYWYDSKVFTVYYEEGHTLDSLAKKTGISRNSLFTTLKKVRTKLKEILDDEIFCEE
jgi:RNA polymerase sigma factor (sigma-70 family)